MVLGNTTWNLTGMQEADTVLGLVSYANNETGSLLITLAVLAFFIITIAVMKGADIRKRLLVSGFVWMLISSLFTYAGLLSFWFPLVFLFITASTAFALVMQR